VFTPGEILQLVHCLPRLGFSADHKLIQALNNKERIDLNTADENGFTPLRKAIQKQDKEAIKLLYSLEKNPKYLSDYDWAILDEVVFDNKEKI
jgi:hypothetical protein